MSNLLDITGADIAQLDDATLRELIGLLCEADYSLAGLPVAGITWGGNQDAADGGLDVVVRGELPPPANSYVPRPVTGFQVRKPKMSKGKILQEMRPKGLLRANIQELIAESGAYVLISSGDSTTESTLKTRKDAMREAVANEDPHRSLHLDFLDRGRVATWVRCHASLVIWVRNKINRPVHGWRPYGNWTNSPGGKDGEYLLDDGLRLLDGTAPTAPPLSAEDGLCRLRSVLSAPGTSVRLVGLSGVGKTRLVQAIFDDSIGHNAINPSQAIYTDIEVPVPDPCSLATQLITRKARQVLIVDNCRPDLHRRVTNVCSQPHSTVSVLTVEYDVRDDLPEETSVFRLEPASQEMIEKLIRNRFSHLGQVDAGTIAAFSGGNARVAIAIAATVQRGETLSGFRDEGLFERLFWQRHEQDKCLLASAEVCSLVYSFDVSDPSSADSELHVLASLADLSGPSLFRAVAELQDRDLVQARSRWRAVLPHAIANRLAARALKRIPHDTIMGVFLNGTSERLLRSFARRLGYLHDCRDAIAIVEGWLGTNGWIGGSIDKLTSVGMDVLATTAPVAPEMTLATIERAAKGERGPLFTSLDNAHYRDLIQLLQQLAYDPELFSRSVELLCRYALSGANDNDASNTARLALQCLFQLHGSGTHAPLESRAKVIRKLANSKDLGKQDLGLALLDAALKTRDFELLNTVGFGARPSDYGYQPSTREDLARWYATFVDICADVAMSDQPYAHDARKLLANSFRGLWSDAGVYDALEDAAGRIHRRAAWNEGWLAVRTVIQYDRPRTDTNVRERLDALERLLRPRDLLEQTRAFVVSDKHCDIVFDDDHAGSECPSERWRLAGDKCRSLGAQVALCPDVLAALLPEVMCSCSSWVVDFGRGLGDGSSDRWQLWRVLRVAFENSPPEKRRIDLVLGYLSSCAESDPGLYSAILDTLVKDELLAEWLPVLQTASAIDQRGIERLHEFLDCQASPMVWFRALARGCSHECINDDELAGLLTKVLSRKDGLDATLEILWMRLCHSNGKVPNGSSQLMTVARNALLFWTRDHERRGGTGDDYRLAEIAHTCLNGPGALPAARTIAQQLATEVFEGRLSVPECPMLLGSLAECQPLVFLDAFLTPGNATPYWVRRMFSDHNGRGCNPLGQVPTDVLLSWCNADPSIRYPIVASAVTGFVGSKATGAPQWQPIVYAIIEHAPEPAVVLERLAEAIMPRSWWGSLADVLERRLVIFRELRDHREAEVRAWATNHVDKLEEAIRRERERETKCAREPNERFED